MLDIICQVATLQTTSKLSTETAAAMAVQKTGVYILNGETTSRTVDKMEESDLGIMVNL